MQHTEVLVVGGGPAGAACAWRLRQQGVDCRIVDRRAFPRVKLCAGWITPQVLRDLELDPADYPGSMTVFGALHISICGVRIRLPTRQYAIRRYEFDHWLLQRAGAPVHRHEVKRIEQTTDGYLVDGAFSAPFLVGAGGTRCPVYRTFFQGTSPRSADSLIVTMEQEFRYPYTDARCHLWFMEHGLSGYAWYVPKIDPQGRAAFVNVGIGGGAAGLRSRDDHLRRHWELLVTKLDRLGLVRGHDWHPRGYAYHLRQAQPQVRRGNALIVGDAVGLATRDMGEGIGPAIRSGLLAAEAILSGGDYKIHTIPKVSLLPSPRRLLDSLRRRTEI